MRQILALSMLAGLILAGCSTSEKIDAGSTATSDAAATMTAALPSGAKKGDPPAALAVFSRIAGLTDCSALQGEFDNAAANQGREVGSGNIDAAKLATRYMEAADKRMRDIGCSR